MTTSLVSRTSVSGLPRDPRNTMMTGGPWAGRPCIGKSLAVGPGGEVLAWGPYGVDAEALVIVDVELRPPVGTGTDIARALPERGSNGP